MYATLINTYYIIDNSLLFMKVCTYLSVYKCLEVILSNFIKNQFI